MPDDHHDEAGALSPDTAPDTVFEQFLEEGVLAFQRCATNGHPVFPPRVLCPACGDPRLEWQRSGGEGVVYSLTSLAPRGEEPYLVALVDVAEGFRLMTNVVSDGEVAIGDPVRPDFSAGVTPAGPLFVPAAQR